MMALLRGRQGLFLVMTFIVMVVVILLSKDATTALVLISLITNFLIISSQLTLISERHEDDESERANRGQDGAVAPDALPWVGATQSGFQDGTPLKAKCLEGSTLVDNFAPQPAPGPAAGYPGGLNSTDLDDMGYSVGPVASLPPGTGPVYNVTGENPSPALDNPYSLNRLETRADPTYGQSGACDYGLAGEARNTHDADQQIAQHARWRNDPYRVAAGIMRRKDLMDKYVREELDEEEDSYWWGRWDA